MLITYQDDGVLRIYRSVEDAVRDVEALDAEAACPPRAGRQYQGQRATRQRGGQAAPESGRS
jgi:hypothetical protein